MRGAISSPQRPKSRIEIRSATRRASSSSSSPDDQPLRVPRIRPSSRSSSTLRRTSPSSGLSATTVRTNSTASSTRDPPNEGCACLNSSSLTSAAARSRCRSSWKASAAIGAAWPTISPFGPRVEVRMVAGCEVRVLVPDPGERRARARRRRVAVDPDEGIEGLVRADVLATGALRAPCCLGDNAVHR